MSSGWLGACKGINIRALLRMLIHFFVYLTVFAPIDVPYYNLLPAGSEEHEVLQTGSIQVAILPLLANTL